MSEDIQRNYNQLKNLCKKQQTVILKLQQEIRQRCQSYLLHASKYKKGSAHKENSQQKNDEIARSPIRIPKSFDEQQSDGKLTSSKISILIDRTRLSICSHQIDIFQQGSKQITESQSTQNSSINESIVESFKERLILLQKNKNEVVRELEKAGERIKELQKIVGEQGKELEKLNKSESKLKQKLAKNPQYEQSLNQIYRAIFKAENNSEGEGPVNTSEKTSRVLKVVNGEGNELQVIQWLEEVGSSRLNHHQQGGQKLPNGKTNEKKTLKNEVTLETTPTKMEESAVQKTDLNEVHQFTIIKRLEEHSHQLEQQINSLRNENILLKQQLSRSRVTPPSETKTFINDLNSSKKQAQIQKSAEKETPQRQVAKTTQVLQTPYYVEEDIQPTGNSEYVKRSFIRKKIVSRNLSATTYRVVSKSKEQVQAIVSGRLNFENTSVEKPKKKEAPKSRQTKIQELKNSVQRVSEVSRDSQVDRNSGIATGEEVKVFQVQTVTPRQIITTTKVYSGEGETSRTQRRKN